MSSIRQPLGSIKLTGPERRELTALTNTHITAMRNHPDDYDSMAYLYTSTARAIHDRDLIACAALYQTAQAAVKAAEETENPYPAANMRGAANILAAALKHLGEKEGAA